MTMAAAGITALLMRPSPPPAKMLTQIRTITMPAPLAITTARTPIIMRRP
ncbi:hypothetical protein FHS78_003147 [Parvibaculum indicum]|nr:hypothetical protein [Parvibaculum indicum]|tara:strand:+ start:5150 stop:5299 length:150 start_codon:yes stop_codon:yes gene_type:complete